MASLNATARIAPTETAMLSLKAFAVGLVTDLLAPVVVAVVQWAALAAGFVGRVAVTGGGVGGASFDVYQPTSWSPGLFITQIAIGFAVGFLFTLWRAFVTRAAR